MPGAHDSPKGKDKVPRFVTCEQCGHAYGYWLQRTGVGDAVPCPSCGWYQEHMIAQVRLARYGWLVRVGWLLFVLGVGGIVVGGCLAIQLHTNPLWLGMGRVLQAFALLALFAPLASYLLKARLAARYDPNAGDVEERKRCGQKRAMKPNEHAQLAPKPASEDGNP
jgi:hypothetical protein